METSTGNRWDASGFSPGSSSSSGAAASTAKRGGNV